MLSSLSLSRQADRGRVFPGEGWPRGVVDAHRPTYKESTDNPETMAAMVKLSREIGVSASDVVVHSMVR